LDFSLLNCFVVRLLLTFCTTFSCAGGLRIGVAADSCLYFLVWKRFDFVVIWIDELEESYS
jgi:hypothetical protein